MVKVQFENNLTEQPSPSVHFFPFSEGGVLFIEGTRRILNLNNSAAVIWCLLGQVSSFENFVSELTYRFPIDRETASRDIEATVRFFEQEGLLGVTQPLAQSAVDDFPQLYIQGPEVEEPASWIFKQYFKISDHVFEIASQDVMLGESFASVMSHLAESGEMTADTSLWILPSKEIKDAWDIYLDQRLFSAGVQKNSVLPDLMFVIFIRSCDSLNDRLLFHAAVIEKGRKAIIFPAVTRSGKTTLAAALSRQGWRFYSDELAVLNKENLKVSPFLLPMSIKNGSVEVLKKYYPALPEAEVYLRPDNKRVRYIIAPQESLASEEEEAPVGALVFLEYSPEAASSQKEIGKADALKRLAATGSSDRELAMDDVEAMIAIVEQVPCHELVFSDLDNAIELLKDSVIT